MINIFDTFERKLRQKYTRINNKEICRYNNNGKNWEVRADRQNILNPALLVARMWNTQHGERIPALVNNNYGRYPKIMYEHVAYPQNWKG